MRSLKFVGFFLVEINLFNLGVVVGYIFWIICGRLFLKKRLGYSLSI